MIYMHLSAGPGGVMVTILAARAACHRGSIPGCSRSASNDTVSGTASAGDKHSLALVDSLRIKA